MMNPEYEADKLGLEVLTVDEPDLSYEYNILMFARKKGETGAIYIASDSGCSCPTPFEEYEGENADQVLAKMDKVTTLEDAQRKFDEWNKHSLVMATADEFPRQVLRGWLV